LTEQIRYNLHQICILYQSNSASTNLGNATQFLEGYCKVFTVCFQESEVFEITDFTTASEWERY